MSGQRANGPAATTSGKPDLFTYYMIAIEAAWTRLRGPGDAAAKDPIKDRIQVLLNECNERFADWDEYWKRAFEIEHLIGTLLPEAELRAEVPRRLLEAEKLGVASAETIKKTWDDALTEPDDSKREARMRAVYQSLLEDLHWIYGKRRLDRSERRKAAKPIAWYATGLAATAAIVQLLFATCPGVSPHSYGLATAITFGALGAFFSRLTAFNAAYRTLDYDDIGTLFRWNVIAIRLLLGVIGSLVLFYAQLGGLLAGELFPDFKNWRAPETTVAGEAWLNANAAKLVVWSFIGGFSERLVPDTLQRLEANAAKDKPE